MAFQIKQSALDYSRGHTVAVGMLSDIIAPDMRFIVTFRLAADNKNYVASCIDLCMDGYGIDLQNAIIDMMENVKTYMDVLFSDRYKGDNWVQLADMYNDNFTVVKDAIVQYNTGKVMLVERNSNEQIQSILKHGILAKWQNLPTI